MALPPTVPTSFVPHPSSAAGRRRSDIGGAFAFFGYGVLALVVALGIAAFIYSRILIAEKNATDAELQERVAAIDPATIAEFVHLRDRLSYGQTLLNEHVALTGFFEVLISVMPSGVRFNDLHILVRDDGVPALEATGIAASFNALAATSDLFAADGRIKDAIFSGISVEGNAVTFTLSANIDPTLVAFTSAPPAPPAPVATTTPPETP